MSANSWREIYEEGTRWCGCAEPGFPPHGVQVCWTRTWVTNVLCLFAVYSSEAVQMIFFRHIFERFFAHNEVKITKYLKVCLFLIVFFCVCLCSQDSGSVSLAEFLCTGSRVWQVEHNSCCNRSRGFINDFIIGTIVCRWQVKKRVSVLNPCR